MDKTYKNNGMADNPLSVAIQQRDADPIALVRDALRLKDVQLAFQPVVRSQDISKPAFFEGLVRVLDSTKRIIPARDFIHAIENLEEGRIIDCLALEMGLNALANNPQLRLSINLSAKTIGYPAWEAALERGLYGRPTVAERLIIEITEASAMDMPDLVIDFMARMSQFGCAFALDDFGAGYTAFRYFKDFFFDIVKIDGEFIRNIDKDADNQVITKALASIAKQFDMFTVAEFVERPQEATYLIENGIDCMQGYLFGAPSAVPVMPGLHMSQKTA